MGNVGGRLSPGLPFITLRTVWNTTPGRSAGLDFVLRHYHRVQGFKRTFEHGPCCLMFFARFGREGAKVDKAWLRELLGLPIPCDSAFLSSVSYYSAADQSKYS